ncbi:DegT/DnrJ/EryC1/StrS family aminotransferase [Streptomyces sp. NPDC005263]|uniref:DegT/DnrJ/EryC1/StrS family aminotransferase n=1 Tax=Streptomyces sp. NPDC005263 TaxID=3364711 RepID=UPI0036781110
MLLGVKLGEAVHGPRLDEELQVWRTHIPRKVRWRSTRAMRTALRRGEMLGSGATRELERRFRESFDRHAVAVSSGMDGLELLLEHYGVGQGRTVVVPANCFPSIPALARQLGARPVAAQIDDAHLCLAPEACRWEVLDEAPIVVWVHHAGMVGSAAMQSITRLREAGCTVVEDCAYLLPDSAPAGGPGTWGDGAIFSFHQIKPMGAAGGGVVLTREGRVADELAVRRSHSGQESRWQEGDVLCRGRELSEFAAAAAVARFVHRDKIRDRLRSLAEEYATSLARWLPPGRVPQDTWGRFTIRARSAGEAALLRENLNRRRISTNVMFAFPWTSHPAFSDVTQPNAPELTGLLRSNVCVPYHPGMRCRDARRVAAAVAEHSSLSRHTGH